jgi:hypothetical protein
VDLLARLDHRAVGEPSDDRRYLPGRHSNHHLIEQRDALRNPSQPDQSPASEDPAMRQQVRVVEALTDLMATRSPVA